MLSAPRKAKDGVREIKAPPAIPWISAHVLRCCFSSPDDALWRFSVPVSALPICVRLVFLDNKGILFTQIQPTVSQLPIENHTVRKPSKRSSLSNSLKILLPSPHSILEVHSSG